MCLHGCMQVLLELNYRTGINALDTAISLGEQLWWGSMLLAES